jgi:hypothetical protein
MKKLLGILVLEFVVVQLNFFRQEINQQVSVLD